MDKTAATSSKALTTHARIVGLIYLQRGDIVALKISPKSKEQIIEINNLVQKDLDKTINADVKIDVTRYDQIKVVVEFLNNASNCKACQQGNGCGALFFNELAKPTRNLFTISLNVLYSQVKTDYSIDEIISIGVHNSVYWMSISVLYILPMLLCIILPLAIIKTLALQVNEFILILLVFGLLACYYFMVKNRFHHSSFTIYIQSDKSQPNCPKITQL